MGDFQCDHQETSLGTLTGQSKMWLTRLDLLCSWVYMDWLSECCTSLRQLSLRYT